MPNYVFNSVDDPVFSLLTNSFTTPGVVSPVESAAAKAGILYVVSSGSTAVPGGVDLLLQVSNPIANSKTLYLSSITGGTSAAATLTFYSGGTITGGSSPTPFNTSFGSSNTSSMNTALNTGTIGGVFTEFSVFPLTVGMFTVDFVGGLLVPPGRELTVSVGTGAITASANITWWEY